MVVWRCWEGSGRVVLRRDLVGVSLCGIVIGKGVERADCNDSRVWERRRGKESVKGRMGTWEERFEIGKRHWERGDEDLNV